MFKTIIFIASLLLTSNVYAETRIKDIAVVEVMRENLLVGYG